MSQLQIHPLAWTPDPARWLERVRDLGDSVWLDSGRPHGQRGRFDIISAAPVTVVQSTRQPGWDPFMAVRAATADALGPAVPNSAGIPFVGGAIGILGYEAVAQPTVPDPTAPALPFPDARFGVYSWAVICDHAQRRASLIIHPATPQAVQNELLGRLRAPLPTVPAVGSPFQLASEWTATPTVDDYRTAFSRIQHYIHAGDCYQVNLARRWNNRYRGDPWSAYLELRQRAAAPFGAWLETPHGTVLCQSPERFLQCRNGELWTQPIKGTAPRGGDAAVDLALGEALVSSAKNRAENVMIVDLLRNDLGRVAVPGSVAVDRLFELQKFATVQHLVSSVRAALRPELDALEAWRHCFPGGSITGAPKLRAMQIINELEPFRRSVFCGSIGYVSACGGMDTNIAIRTLLALDGEIHAWAGGGIVADSTCEEEFAECAGKIEPLLAALGAQADR